MVAGGSDGGGGQKAARPVRGKQTCRKHLFLPVHAIFPENARALLHTPWGSLKRLLSAGWRVSGEKLGEGAQTPFRQNIITRCTSPLKTASTEGNLPPAIQRYTE